MRDATVEGLQCHPEGEERGVLGGAVAHPGIPHRLVRRVWVSKHLSLMASCPSVFV